MHLFWIMGAELGILGLGWLEGHGSVILWTQAQVNSGIILMFLHKDRS